MTPFMNGTDLTETLLPATLISLLHIAGPDHLGTLMALSSLTKPVHAFQVGALWSLGHCAGMGLVALVAVPLGTIGHGNIDTWEHLGNYVIGISMVIVGVYFVLREAEFLRVQADGSVVLQGCACHPPPEPTPEMMRHSSSRGRPRKFIIQKCCDSEDCEQVATETTALLPGVPGQPPSEAKSGSSLMDWRVWQGILIGLLQGACCPAAIVGLGAAAEQPNMSRVLAFVVLFLFISAVGAGLMAMAWAWMTQAGLGALVPPKAIYRFSCYGTLILGLAWTIANAFGILDQLDYTSGIHDHAGTAAALQRSGNATAVSLLAAGRSHAVLHSMVVGMH